jgi:CRP/FNR family cyclic AMP-dependent transcriptional regulator
MVSSGDLLGELAVLGGMPRSGSAICVADTTAWAVDGQQFPRFLTDHPPVALALLSALSRLVVSQSGLVDDMLFLDLRGRVAKRLLGLATKSWDAPPTDGTVLDWGLSQADLAYLCGGTRANVRRVPLRIRPSTTHPTLWPPVHPARRQYPPSARRALSREHLTLP